MCPISSIIFIKTQEYIGGNEYDASESLSRLDMTSIKDKQTIPEACEANADQKILWMPLFPTSCLILENLVFWKIVRLWKSIPSPPKSVRNSCILLRCVYAFLITWPRIVLDKTERCEVLYVSKIPTNSDP